LWRRKTSRMMITRMVLAAPAMMPTISTVTKPSLDVASRLLAPTGIVSAAGGNGGDDGGAGGKLGGGLGGVMRRGATDSVTSDAGIRRMVATLVLSALIVETMDIAASELAVPSCTTVTVASITTLDTVAEMEPTPSVEAMFAVSTLGVEMTAFDEVFRTFVTSNVT